MKMLVGLGNPGRKYEGSRHNIGFDVVEALVKDQGLHLDLEKFRADYTIWRYGGEKILVVKPYTFMNLSGEAVLPLMSYYGIGMEDLLVIYDDLDLEAGRLRLRKKGSGGGQKGMQSIIDMLGSNDFQRIRIGIGRPAPGWKVVDHVLAPFDPTTRIEVDQTIEQAVNVIKQWARGANFDSLMQENN